MARWGDGQGDQVPVAPQTGTQVAPRVAVGGNVPGPRAARCPGGSVWAVRGKGSGPWPVDGAAVPARRGAEQSCVGSRGLDVPHICGREGAVGRFRRQIGAADPNEPFGKWILTVVHVPCPFPSVGG